VRATVPHTLWISPNHFPNGNFAAAPRPGQSFFVKNVLYHHVLRMFVWQPQWATVAPQVSVRPTVVWADGEVAANTRVLAFAALTPSRFSRNAARCANPGVAGSTHSKS